MRLGGARWTVLELIQHLVALIIGDLDEVFSEAPPAAAIQRQNAGDELRLRLSQFLRLQHEIDVLRNLGVDRTRILVARNDPFAGGGEDRKFRLGKRSIWRGGGRSVRGTRSGRGISLASGADQHHAAPKKGEAVNENAAGKPVRPAASARHGA